MGSAAEAECLARLAGDLGYLPDATVRELESLLGGRCELCTVSLAVLAEPPSSLLTTWGVGSGTAMPKGVVGWEWFVTALTVPPARTVEYHSPLPTVLEDLDCQVPSGPLFEIIEEGSQGRQRRVQILIQHRIRRHLAERAVAVADLAQYVAQ
jgi:hypothetical protein